MGFGEFCNSVKWRRSMAHSRVGTKVWLWRVVTWPVAQLSSLFGLAQKATAHRMAGETEFYGDVRDVVIRYLPVCVVLTE